MTCTLLILAASRPAVGDPRPDTVFVTGNAVRAGGWADWAPKATWDALWSVYRVRHPEVGWGWTTAQEGHLWVPAQRLYDPPAVVEVVAALGVLRNKLGSYTVLDRFRRVIGSDGSPEELERQPTQLRGIAELLIRSGDLKLRGCTQFPAGRR